MEQEARRVKAFLQASGEQAKPKKNILSKTDWARLEHAAWNCLRHAFVIGNTKVGAAAMASDGSIYSGCNVEHRFRCHDVHAEVNAITSMVAAGRKELRAIVVAAERERFVPCGGCMDWIFQFGGPACLVGYQSRQGGRGRIFRADDLMPQYPK